MRSYLVFIALIAGCADVATTVNVAPSAEDHAEQAAQVVDQLNGEIGGEVFRVRVVDHEHRVDDEIIMRAVPSLGGATRGVCDSTRRGVIVYVTPATKDVQMAHELGHAAGLDHHPDPGNFMYRKATKWGVTWTQRNHLMGTP